MCGLHALAWPYLARLPWPPVEKYEPVDQADVNRMPGEADETN
ncbi:hypothetical protein [Nonomuraea dietziae]